MVRVDAGANVTELRTSANSVTTPVLGGKAIAFDGTQTTLQIGAGWELDLWGRVKRETGSRQAQLDAASLDAAAARVALTADVAAAYWQWRALADEAQVLGRLLASRRCGPAGGADPVRCGRSHHARPATCACRRGRRRGGPDRFAAPPGLGAPFDCGPHGPGGCRPALAGHAVGPSARRRRWLAG